MPITECPRRAQDHCVPSAQFQIQNNNSLLKHIQDDIKLLKEDIIEMKRILDYLKKYTENKEKIENGRWFR